MAQSITPSSFPGAPAAVARSGAETSQLGSSFSEELRREVDKSLSVVDVQTKRSNPSEAEEPRDSRVDAAETDSDREESDHHDGDEVVAGTGQAPRDAERTQDETTSGEQDEVVLSSEAEQAEGEGDTSQQFEPGSTSELTEELVETVEGSSVETTEGEVDVTPTSEIVDESFQPSEVEAKATEAGETVATSAVETTENTEAVQAEAAEADTSPEGRSETETVHADIESVATEADDVVATDETAQVEETVDVETETTPQPKETTTEVVASNHAPASESTGLSVNDTDERDSTTSSRSESEDFKVEARDTNNTADLEARKPMFVDAVETADEFVSERSTTEVPEIQRDVSTSGPTNDVNPSELRSHGPRITTSRAATLPAQAEPQVDASRFVTRVSRAFQAAEQNGGTMRLRLSPPELGAMRIELTMQQGGLTAKVETETQTAKNILLDNLPVLRERLAAQEIRVDKFEVDVRQDNQSGQDSWQMQDRQQGDQPKSRGATGVEDANVSTDEGDSTEHVTHLLRSVQADGRLNVVA